MVLIWSKKIRQRLQEMLQLPSGTQLHQEVFACVPKDLAAIAVSYAHQSTSELFQLHVADVRDDFLSVPEVLVMLDATDNAREFGSVFLPYMSMMFEDLPPLDEWPFFMQRRAKKNIVIARGSRQKRDWDLQARVSDLQQRRACCGFCCVEHGDLKLLLLDAQALTESLPEPGLRMRRRFEIARYAELRFVVVSVILIMSGIGAGLMFLV